MFSFTLDGGDETMGLVEGQLQDLARLVAQEDEDTIPGEMIKWQAEDMKRQYPNLGQQDAETYYTEIWPRSRTYIKPLRIKNLVTLRRKPLTTLTKGRAGVTSVRPILRDELMQKFIDRMANLLNRVMAWR